MLSIFSSLTFPHVLCLWFYCILHFESLFNVLNTFLKRYRFTVCSFPQEPSVTHTSHRQAQQPVLYLVSTQDNTHSRAYLAQVPSTAQRAWQRWHRSGEADTVTTTRPPVISTHLAEPNAVQLSAARVLDMEI